LLGVSRSQVSQWRLDAGGVIKTELRESPRYLSRADRYEIARLREHGLGVRAIGKRLDWAASTVSRELRRNDASRDGRRDRLVRGYQPELAHQLMLARRHAAQTIEAGPVPGAAGMGAGPTGGA